MKRKIKPLIKPYRQLHEVIHVRADTRTAAVLCTRCLVKMRKAIPMRNKSIYKRFIYPRPQYEHFDGFMFWSREPDNVIDSREHVKCEKCGWTGRGR